MTLLDHLSLNESETEFLHRPEVHPSTKLFFQEAFFQFPLWIGDDSPRHGDLFHDLTAVKDGNATLTAIDFDAKRDGVSLCKVSYSDSAGDYTYWIDVNRGTVPVRFEERYRENNSTSTFVYGDIEQFPNGGWLPRRKLHYLTDGAHVNRLVIKSVDVQKRPTASAFQLEFSEPVRLVNQAEGVIYRQGKTWSLLKLPAPGSPGTEKFIASLTPPPEMPGEIETAHPWAAFLLVVAGVFLGLWWVVYLRRRGRGSTATV